MKLLIVEDNAPMREVMKRMVGDLADQISECSDGDEVVAAYAAEQPDWVLMDIEMKRIERHRGDPATARGFPRSQSFDRDQLQRPAVARRRSAGRRVRLRDQRKPD